MKNVQLYLMRSSIAGLALFVVFVGVSVIAAILEAMTWEDLGQWSLKAFFVAVVAILVTTIVGVLASFAKVGKK
jgi:uncharacterized transporter YbjL